VFPRKIPQFDLVFMAGTSPPHHRKIPVFDGRMWRRHDNAACQEMVRVRKWSNDVHDDRSSHHSNVGGGTDFVYPNCHMRSRRDYKNGEMEMAVCEWLRMQESDCYCNGFFKVVPRCNKCIYVLTDFAEKYRCFGGINERNFTF